ncbi:MAG: hypothetical protein QOK40_129 [Miltoncostaeaceae bacterium]|jgi:hypothetical protein|nr:hypothetical protein [Miltoncostaeaceae bacterium]
MSARAAVGPDERLVSVMEGDDRAGESWGMYYARGENFRHVRHGQILARWPVLPEPWAELVEEARIAAVDRTPGAATFGR